MFISPSQLHAIFNPILEIIEDKEIKISELSIDSRKIDRPENTLFFALDGVRKKGIEYVAELAEKGVKSFVIPQKYQKIWTPPEAVNLYFVDNMVQALQHLAIYKRNALHFNAIGITGSNGKTIVKEWLSTLLESDFRLAKTPKSYNSQIGVALSVWEANESTEWGVFEAGISTTSEMQQLEKMIRPKVGILTNIGAQHSEGFQNDLEKLKEKMQLFQHSDVLIFNQNDPFLAEHIPEIAKQSFPNLQLLKWGSEKDADMRISFYKKNDRTLVNIEWKAHSFSVEFPFSDDASLENIGQALTAALYLGMQPSTIQSKISSLMRLGMRLEILDGIQHIRLINDAYSSDIQSLTTALQFLNQQAQGGKYSAILSEFSNMDSGDYGAQFLEKLKGKHFEHLILIGSSFYPIAEKLKVHAAHLYIYPNTADFVAEFPHYQINNCTLLVKGARKFHFEKIIALYQTQTHQTFLEVNLNAIKHNLNQFAELLNPKTKVMIMLKANGYGLGSAEIAKVLEYQKADYFAVAYLDEGIELRQKGIKTPMMIMNSDAAFVSEWIDYQLEPEVYSLENIREIIAQSAVQLQSSKKLPIHLKLDTGMNRLGFKSSDIKELTKLLSAHPQLEIKSIFSHLAAADSEDKKWFTERQWANYQKMATEIEKSLDYKPLKHILNTEGIVKFPEYQMDMVRLGIGLYGVEPLNILENRLELPLKLKAKIAQIKTVKADEFVGYSLNGKPQGETDIAIVNIGYADGFLRAFGNGKVQVRIQNKYFPTLGNVCMDMIMINLGKNHGINLHDEALLIYDHESLYKMAEAADTIPYEILTLIGRRVKRVYFEA